MSATKSSTSGLNCIEICDIIKACGDAGVNYLKFGRLELFFQKENQLEKFAEPSYGVVPVEEEAEIVDNIEKELSDQAELEELKILDPFKYEEMLENRG